MHWAQVIIYSIVQGITELFPVSSVGHGVMLPYLAGWNEISSSSVFLPFVVMLHLGTALALIIYFWRDWVDFIRSLFSNRPQDRKILLLIIVATIPAALIGKLLEKKLTALFPHALSAALFLIVNGIILIIADRWRKGSRHRKSRSVDGEIAKLSYGQSFFIGVIQALALIPGFSRSGITMAAGLRAGLSYEASARFSFLLATPIILGAGVLEVPHMLKSHNSQMLHFGLVGGLLSGIVAFISTAVLMRWFKNHEVRALRPFAVYCIGAGVIVAILAALNIHG